LLSAPIAPVIRITASSGVFARYIDVPLKDVPGHEPVDAGELAVLSFTLMVEAPATLQIALKSTDVELPTTRLIMA
jgi:hypothetical protein